jgi:nicotinate-nucleotide adenylyltransferase
MRIGHLGGSFDPVHLGHLALARACREGADLDLVVLVVVGTPPHKRDRRLADAVHRVSMARLAAVGDPHLAVDDRETRRSGASYTVDTVRQIMEQHPDDEHFWIIGGDTLPELSLWRDIEELLDLVGFVTAARPGHDPESGLSELLHHVGEDRVERLRSRVVSMPPCGISSTEVRRRAREGRPIADLVPDAVARYIEEKKLYR